MSPFMNRREALAALATTAAVPFMQACGGAATPAAPARNAAAEARTLLDEIGENYLRFAPEGATSLGIDTGARAALRSQLADRSTTGQQRIAEQVRKDLARATAFDTNGLDHATRTSIEVVRSAYTIAAEGFAALSALPDAYLCACLGVPGEQVPLRRAELGLDALARGADCRPA